MNGNNTERYDQLKEKADEYEKGFGTGTLRFDNSSHLSTVIQKYQQTLDEAKRLKDDEKIKEMQDKIHHYNTV